MNSGALQPQSPYGAQYNGKWTFGQIAGEIICEVIGKTTVASV